MRFGLAYLSEVDPGVEGGLSLLVKGVFEGAGREPGSEIRCGSVSFRTLE